MKGIKLSVRKYPLYCQAAITEVRIVNGHTTEMYCLTLCTGNRGSNCRTHSTFFVAANSINAQTVSRKQKHVVTFKHSKGRRESNTTWKCAEKGVRIKLTDPS